GERAGDAADHQFGIVGVEPKMTVCAGGLVPLAGRAAAARRLLPLRTAARRKCEEALGFAERYDPGTDFRIGEGMHEGRLQRRADPKNEIDLTQGLLVLIVQ